MDERLRGLATFILEHLYASEPELATARVALSSPPSPALEAGLRAIKRQLIERERVGLLALAEEATRTPPPDATRAVAPVARDTLARGTLVVSRDGTSTTYQVQRGVPLLIGGRYLARRKIAVGGHAVVLEAEDLRPVARDLSRVAVKVSTRTQGEARREEREIRSLARIDHPNVVPVLDCGSWEGQFYYVMPLASMTLAEFLRRSPRDRLALADVLGWIGACLRGLAALHAEGIVSRDVKPQNILLFQDRGSFFRPCIADLGIAKELKATDGAATPEALTEPGREPGGTPAYMAPEQQENQATAGLERACRVDVFSMACVLFELLAGEPPFGRGPEAMAAVRAYVQPPALVDRVPLERRSDALRLDPILGRALARDPSVRPSAAELAALLEGLVR